MTKENKKTAKGITDSNDYQSKDFVAGYVGYISNLISKIDNDEVTLKKASEINNSIGKLNGFIRNKVADEQLQLNREIFEASNKNLKLNKKS